MEKKNWKKPELEILVRNRPDEAVLGTCKLEGSGSDNMGAEEACLENGCATYCLNDHTS